MLLGYHQQPNSTLLCGVCCTGPCFYDHTQGFLSDFCSSPCQVVYLEFQVHLLKIKQLLDRHPNLRRFTSEILPSFAASTPISPPLCSVCMSTASMYDFQQRVYLMLCVECSAKESPSVVVGNTGGEGSSSSMALSSSTRSKNQTFKSSFTANPQNHNRRTRNKSTPPTDTHSYSLNPALASLSSSSSSLLLYRRPSIAARSISEVIRVRLHSVPPPLPVNTSCSSSSSSSESVMYPPLAVKIDEEFTYDPEQSPCLDGDEGWVKARNVKSGDEFLIHLDCVALVLDDEPFPKTNTSTNSILESSSKRLDVSLSGDDLFSNQQPVQLLDESRNALVMSPQISSLSDEDEIEQGFFKDLSLDTEYMQQQHEMQGKDQQILESTMMSPSSPASPPSTEISIATPPPASLFETSNVPMTSSSIVVDLMTPTNQAPPPPLDETFLSSYMRSTSSFQRDLKAEKKLIPTTTRQLGLIPDDKTDASVKEWLKHGNNMNETNNNNIIISNSSKLKKKRSSFFGGVLVDSESPRTSADLSSSAQQISVVSSVAEKKKTLSKRSSMFFKRATRIGSGDDEAASVSAIASTSSIDDVRLPTRQSPPTGHDDNKKTLRKRPSFPFYSKRVETDHQLQDQTKKQQQQHQQEQQQKPQSIKFIKHSDPAVRVPSQKIGNMTVAAFSRAEKSAIIPSDGDANNDLNNHLSLASAVTENMKSIPFIQRSVMPKINPVYYFENSDDDGNGVVKNNRCAPKKRQNSDEFQVQQIIQELISVEENYCKQLGAIIDHILPQKNRPTEISDYEIFSIFKGFKKLHCLSENLLKEMKLANATDGYATMMDGFKLEKPFAVASVFAKHVLDFSLYPKYVQNYCHFKNRIEELLQIKCYYDWFKKTMSDRVFGRQDITHFLTLPVRHVPRYSLLLGRLQKASQYLQKSSSTIPQQMEVLQIAKEFVVQLARRMDQAEEEEDALLRMFSICSGEIEDCPSEILSHHRRFLQRFDGVDVRELLINNTYGAAGSSKKELMGFTKNTSIYLFSDLVLITMTSPMASSKMNNNGGYGAEPVEMRFQFKTRVNLDGANVVLTLPTGSTASTATDAVEIPDNDCPPLHLSSSILITFETNSNSNSNSGCGVGTIGDRDESSMTPSPPTSTSFELVFQTRNDCIRFYELILLLVRQF